MRHSSSDRIDHRNTYRRSISILKTAPPKNGLMVSSVVNYRGLARKPAPHSSLKPYSGTLPLAP